MKKFNTLYHDCLGPVEKHLSNAKFITYIVKSTIFMNLI